jgi:hypothetical protein
MSLYSENNETCAIKVYEDEQHRIELLMDKVQFKEITRLKKDLEESGTRLEKELDKLKELENKIDNLNEKNKKLEDQLGKVILQDENIYTPENGYTKDYGRLYDSFRYHGNIEYYIINKITLNIGVYGRSDTPIVIHIDNYGFTHRYNIDLHSYCFGFQKWQEDNQKYINSLAKFQEDTQKYIKSKGSYKLPDFIIKKIKHSGFSSRAGPTVEDYLLFINKCRINAVSYYKHIN